MRSGTIRTWAAIGAPEQVAPYATTLTDDALVRTATFVLRQQGQRLVAFGDGAGKAPTPEDPMVPLSLGPFAQAPRALPMEAVRHAVEPVDASAPFWDRPPCPPPLADLLFGGDATTWLLLDAARARTVSRRLDVDLFAAEYEVRDLFRGRSDVSAVSPHLIRLHLPTGGQQPPDCLRAFFEEGWGKGLGTFLRGRVPTGALYDHLRRLTRIPSRGADDDEGWRWFRLWDPRVALPYLAAVRDRPDHVRALTATPAGPIAMVIEDGPEAAVTFTSTLPDDPRARRDRLVFDATDHTVFDGIALDAFRAELSEWLVAAQGLPLDRARLVADHTLAEGPPLGCRTKDDYVFLAHMMRTLGAWFARSGVWPDLTEAMARGTARDPLAKTYTAAHAASAQGALLADWSAVRAHLRDVAGGPHLSPNDLATVRSRFLSGRAEATRCALLPARADLDRFTGLSREETGGLLMLSLLLGFRFYQDPWHPWALPAGRRPTEDDLRRAADAAWTWVIGP